MGEYLPLLIVGAIIGAFSLVFVLAALALKRGVKNPGMSGICPTATL